MAGKFKKRSTEELRGEAAKAHSHTEVGNPSGYQTPEMVRGADGNSVRPPTAPGSSSPVTSHPAEGPSRGPVVTHNAHKPEVMKGLAEGPGEESKESPREERKEVKAGKGDAASRIYPDMAKRRGQR